MAHVGAKLETRFGCFPVRHLNVRSTSESGFLTDTCTSLQSPQLHMGEELILRVYGQLGLCTSGHTIVLRSPVCLLLM